MLAPIEVKTYTLLEKGKCREPGRHISLDQTAAGIGRFDLVPLVWFVLLCTLSILMRIRQGAVKTHILLTRELQICCSE